MGDRARIVLVAALASPRAIAPETPVARPGTVSKLRVCFASYRMAGLGLNSAVV